MFHLEEAAQAISPALQWLADTYERDAIVRWEMVKRVREDFRDIVMEAVQRAESLARLDASLRRLV